MVARYDSLEELFEALAIGAVPPLPHGGYVRVHPEALPERGLTDYLAARQRLAWFRLRLVVTPAVGPHAVELRRYTEPPPDEHGSRDEAPAPRAD